MSTGGATSLRDELHRRIAFAGPITLADYMRTCLTHPKFGYYTTRADMFGARGDFVTSPDISPVFSELLAVCVAHYARHRATRFRLVELGPGNGTLLRILLPTLARLGATPCELHLVDASMPLRQVQRRMLRDLPAHIAPPATWHDSPDVLLHALDEADTHEDTDRPITIVLAHEFFDALPVHVFQRVTSTPGVLPTSAFRERLVDIAREDSGHGDEDATGLRLVLANAVTPASALLALADPRPAETHLELCPAAITLARRLAQRVCADRGLALVLDYGSMQRRGVTLRALATHGPADLLAEPGQCDVTADVDFSVLRRVAHDSGASFLGTVSQRRFLLRLGIAHRFRVLAQTAIERSRAESGDADVLDRELTRLQGDYDRLVGEGPGDMGAVYNVGAICPPDITSLPGFEDAPS